MITSTIIVNVAYERRHSLAKMNSDPPLPSLRYMLGLSEDWLYEGIWTWSSFKGSGRQSKFRGVCARFLHAFLFLYLYNDSRPMLAASYWLLAFGSFIYTCVSRPYRVPSSNACKAILDFTFLVNVTLFIFTVQEIRSAITLASRQTSALAFVNCVGGSMFVFVGVWFRKVRKETWPSFRTLRILNEERGKDFKEWVKVVRDGKSAIAMCAASPESLVPLHLLEVVMHRTRALLFQSLNAK